MNMKKHQNLASSNAYSSRTIAININLLMTLLSAPLAMLGVGWYLEAILLLILCYAAVFLLPVIRFLVLTERMMKGIVFILVPILYSVDAASILISQNLSKVICLIGIFALTGALLRFGKVYDMKISAQK